MGSMDAEAAPPLAEEKAQPLLRIGRPVVQEGQKAKQYMAAIAGKKKYIGR